MILRLFAFDLGESERARRVNHVPDDWRIWSNDGDVPFGIVILGLVVRVTVLRRFLSAPVGAIWAGASLAGVWAVIHRRELFS